MGKCSELSVATAAYAMVRGYSVNGAWIEVRPTDIDGQAEVALVTYTGDIRATYPAANPKSDLAAVSEYAAGILARWHIAQIVGAGKSPHFVALFRLMSREERGESAGMLCKNEPYGAILPSAVGGLWCAPLMPEGAYWYGPARVADVRCDGLSVHRISAPFISPARET